MLRLAIVAWLCLTISTHAATYVRQDFSTEIFGRRYGIQHLEYRLGPAPGGTCFEIYLGPLGSVSCPNPEFVFVFFVGLFALGAVAHRWKNHPPSRLT